MMGRNGSDIKVLRFRQKPASFLVISFTMILQVAVSSQTPVFIYWQRNSENRNLKPNSSPFTERNITVVYVWSYPCQNNSVNTPQLTSLGSICCYPPRYTKVSKLVYLKKKSSSFVIIC